ncbi:YbjN domain-containing protein [Lacibacterium aquatile]|uniref:YbjN domain-containing protein n=1 Tax=Lacibacterium aquatile TaxID=1168082 RepID=A0ABW5DWF0_9PROT
MTTTGLATGQEIPANPLDIVEEIIAANDWPFDRASDDELVAESRGRWCDYRLFFVWRDDVSALHVSCAFDLKVPQTRRREVNDLLSLLNEKLWIGHFDITAEEGMPAFRHTLPLRGLPAGASVEQLEDVVDAALTECERFYPAFQFVVWGGKSANEAMEAALFETIGEA